MHNYTYTYGHATNGNALTRVSGSSVDFLYDANGNMTRDGQTGVQIEYNVINLPQRVFGTSGEIKYIYAANGQRLASMVGLSATYYRNVMVYSKNGMGVEQIEYMVHPEGLVVNEGSAWVYKYFKTDHLGNTRALLAVRNNVLQNENQNTDYYPSGFAHQLNNLHLNRYLFGGKEYQDAAINGAQLGLYDFHARYYNPRLGRWFNQDPALQFSNPYLYGANSPVNFVDPDGEFVVGFISGFLRGLVQKENPINTGLQGGVNEMKIWGGLFIFDPNKNSINRVLEVASRFTRQLPQTILGLAFAHISNWAWQVDRVDYWGGATVLSGNNWGQGGAVTLSSYIMGDRTLVADPNNSLFQHEYGHYLQSQEMGWGFLSRVGIPSLMSAIQKDPNHKYKLFEQDANRRAFLYFNKNVPNFQDDNELWNIDYRDNRGWDFWRNPLNIDRTNTPWQYVDYRDANDLQLLNSLRLKAKWYDRASWLLFPIGPIGVGIRNGYIYNKLNY